MHVCMYVHAATRLPRATILEHANCLLNGLDKGAEVSRMGTEKCSETIVCPWLLSQPVMGSHRYFLAF